MTRAAAAGDKALDETWAHQALAMANVNALRLALYQATGDEELAAIPVVKEPYWAGAYQMACVAPDHAGKVRQKALDYLRSERRDACPLPDKTTLRRMVDLFAGEAVNDFIFNLGQEELGFEEFPRGVEWACEPSAEVKAAFKVVVIGAGVSGIVTGIQLDRLGIPYEIIERNPEIGGTWWTNDYPDARVDIPSHHYQLSFVKNHPWKNWFATQEELKDYIQTIAQQYDVTRKVRFGSQVKEAMWDERAARWRLTVENGAGETEVLTANVVISAAGLFNAPNVPDIPGIESFAGEIFHTTEWNHDYDYRGRNVGLIGVGCTGAQLMPRVARDAGHMTVFQRSPHWVSKMDGYRDAIPAEVQWLFDTIPHYWNWYCFSVFHTLFADDGALTALDPEWRKSGGTINRKNDMLRQTIADHVKAELADRPDLLEKCMPDFPPFARRLIIDNGWFDALKRPNVTLVTEGIEKITPAGIVTRDGMEHALDLIVLGAGFRTERYLWPTHYVGRGGTTLEQAWEGDGARAYLGVAMPKFPNLFVIYGPNMQARAGGLFAWLEIWARYAVGAVAGMLEQGKSVLEVRQDVFDRYNADLDVAQHDCIWGHEGLTSYYLNEHGRQAVNNPFPPSQFYSRVREADLGDYTLR